MFDTPIYQSVHLITFNFFCFKIIHYLLKSLKIITVLICNVTIFALPEGLHTVLAILPLKRASLHKSDPGFYKYLPFWFTSGWRSSMSSCFFCNSSWTSVSFSLSSEKSMELWSRTDLRMKTGFCHIAFVDYGQVTF